MQRALRQGRCSGPGASGGAAARTANCICVMQQRACTFGRLHFPMAVRRPSLDANRRACTERAAMTGTGLPLDGVRVVEMTHMVMGPTCGMILAQLGAEVIKVEPPAGDKTRSLGGMGTSFFPLFNRGKRSVVLDFAKAEDRETMHRLLDSADVFLENFRDGQLEKQGLGADELRRRASASDRRRPQGLSLRPLRASAGARRGRADDVGARCHDRHAREAATRRLLRQRHHGRHVRRDRDPRRALPEARRQQGRRRYPHRAVRELPVPGRPAHGRVRDDRPKAALDAGARARLADLRHLRHRRTASASSSASSPRAIGGASAGSSG